MPPLPRGRICGVWHAGVQARGGWWWKSGGPPARGRVIFPTAPSAVRAGDAAPQSDYYPMSLSPSCSSRKVARGLRAELLFPFSLSSDPLLPSCHHSAPHPTPPPPHVFSLKDEPPMFWRPGRGTRPAAGPAPGVEQLFVFLFTHERVHTGSRRPMRSIVGRALCSRKPQPEPPGARPGPQSQTETACRVRSLSLLPGSEGFV